MSSSLSHRLIVFILAPLTLFLGAGSVLVLKSYEAHLERRMQEDVELVARALQLPLSRAVERGHAGVLERAIESVGNIDRVFGLYVYDDEGRLAASLGDVTLGDPGEPEEPGRPEEAVAGPSDEQSRYTEVSGQRVYSYFVPLLDSGNRINGLLHVARRASEIDETIAALRLRVGLLLLLGLAVASALVTLGHRAAVGRPLLRLRRSMQRVEEGDRHHRAGTEGPAEVAEVARTLNRMLDSLNRAEAEILSRKQTQLDLEQRLKHTEKLAAIGQLAAGVAHELGTPLSVLDGKAQRALRDPALPDEQRRTLEGIRAEVRRTELIVRQLLDFGRRHTLNVRPVPPRQIAVAAADAARARAEAAGTTLHVTIDPEAGPVEVDRVAMERVLVNLIANGVDAAPGGNVSVRYFAEGGRHGFVVEDDGSGIAPEDRLRVLEPFFTTKDIGEGTGLGLSVAHGIVEEHGGRLDFAERPGGGTTVTVALARPAAAVLDEVTVPQPHTETIL
jgi:two-component system NtrC family sensor kinase